MGQSQGHNELTQDVRRDLKVSVFLLKNTWFVSGADGTAK